MSKQQMTRAIATPDGRMLVEQPDGSCRPAEGKADWAALDAMSEEEFEAAIASDPDFWEKAVPVYPVPKARITMRLVATSSISSSARARVTRPASRPCCAPSRGAPAPLRGSGRLFDQARPV